METAAFSQPALLAVVRHAETERNRRKGYSSYFPDEASRAPIRGVADHVMELTPEGESAARSAGLQLRERIGGIDTVWHSGFVRTQATTQLLLRAWPEKERASIVVRRSWLLREKDPGFTYEMTQAQVEAAFPWHSEYQQTTGWFFSRAVGGENMANVADRVFLFLQMLRNENPGGRVLVVTHGDVLRAFRFVLEEQDYEEPLKWHPENCGGVIYEPEKRGGRLVLRHCFSPGHL